MERYKLFSTTMNLLSFSALATVVQALAPTRLLYEYSPSTWIENIAVRHNGSILFTSLTAPGNIHTLDPFDGAAPVEVAAFPGFTSTLGIVETTPDTFFVVASNFSFYDANAPFVNSIWKMEFQGCNGWPSFRKLAEYPAAKLLNGLTKFNDSLLLAADSMLGTLWAIDTDNGVASVAAQDPLMLGPDGNGINGVHFRQGTLYFTNYDMRTLNKVSLGTDARQRGNVTVVGTSLSEKGLLPPFDDFALSPSGDAYIATESGNGIQKVTPEGTVTIVAGNVNSTAIAQSTAAQFGRTKKDRHVLYTTTAGGISGQLYVNGTLTMVGAQIVAVDLSGR